MTSKLLLKTMDVGVGVQVMVAIDDTASKGLGLCLPQHSALAHILGHNDAKRSTRQAALGPDRPSNAADAALLGPSNNSIRGYVSER